MNKASIRVESLVIPTYPEPAKEEMPLFAEYRVHQRSTGRPYPNKATLDVGRPAPAGQNLYGGPYGKRISGRADHAGNRRQDLCGKGQDDRLRLFLPAACGKAGLIGAFGSWVSGGVEFNWPFHHRPSSDYALEACEDGSVVCWLSEHDPIDRMKGMVGVVLRPGATYLETRVKLCNRDGKRRSRSSGEKMRRCPSTSSIRFSSRRTLLM